MEQIRRKREPGVGSAKNSGREPIPDRIGKCHCAGSAISCSIETQCFDLLKNRDINGAYLLAADQILDNPDCWRGHRALGTAMMHQHRPQFATHHLRSALIGYEQSEPNGEHSKLLKCELATALRQDGHLTESRALFSEAAAIDPNFLPARTGLDMIGKTENAKGASVFHGHPLLDKGHVFERAGQYADAWDCYTRAKAELAAKGFTYDAETIRRRFTVYKSHCRSIIMNRLDCIARETWHDFTVQHFFTDNFIKPLFIFGYPRSGTTLIEQIVSCSPDVMAGDELPIIVEMVNSVQRFIASSKPYPECLSELMISDTRIALNEMRYHYLSRLQERFGLPHKPMFITDKMPLNECYLPLIHLLFPDAPKIRLRRNPLDVIISNYSLFLTHGSHQSETPATCADHIEQVDNLIEHYQRKIPDLKFIEIDYERLVDPAYTALVLSHLATFIGIPADPAMMHPELNPRYARTASFAQVREPISNKSVGRWKRFAPQLKAALAGTATGQMEELK